MAPYIEVRASDFMALTCWDLSATVLLRQRFRTRGFQGGIIADMYKIVYDTVEHP